jgi:hypothetical protein
MPEGVCIWSREGCSVCHIVSHWENKKIKNTAPNPLVERPKPEGAASGAREGVAEAPQARQVLLSGQEGGGSA